MKKVRFFTACLAVAFAMVSCASSGGANSAEGNFVPAGPDRLTIRGGQAIYVDLEKITLAALESFYPVFDSRLKPNAAVAIFPIAAEDIKESEIIEEFLALNLLDKYLLIEKRRVDALLDEYDFQRSGQVGVLTIGELLEADVVIFGSITRREGILNLALIAVDVAKRDTLAIVYEELGVEAKTTNAASAQGAMGLANVLLLPPLGGSAEENRTLRILITNLKDINDACNLIDESANTSILPANFNGLDDSGKAFLHDIGCRYEANFVIHSAIQRFGQRNLAIISRYNVYYKKTDAVYYQEYTEPIEAWVKMPGVISSIMKPPITGARQADARNRSTGSYVWVRYRSGVDRVWAERMMGLLMSDYMDAGKTIGRQVSSMEDISDEIEYEISIRQGVDGSIVAYERYGGRRSENVIPNNDWERFMNTYHWGNTPYPNPSLYSNYDPVGYAMNTLLRPLDLNEPSLHLIEVSRQGNRTRFKLPSGYYIDVTDTRDFIRQMRGFSLTMLTGKETKGYDLGISGEKYNYWKYSGEDSSIPDIVSYTKPATPMTRDFVAIATTSTMVEFQVPGSRSLHHFYYATEDDFSKAVLASSARHRTNDAGDSQRYRVYRLQPNTRYYIWVTAGVGHLMWLQSPPSESIVIRTRAQ